MLVYVIYGKSIGEIELEFFWSLVFVKSIKMKRKMQEKGFMNQLFNIDGDLKVKILNIYFFEF